jgi:hypothetical protein
MENFPGYDSDPKVKRTVKRCESLGHIDLKKKRNPNEWYAVSTLRGSKCTKTAALRMGTDSNNPGLTVIYGAAAPFGEPADEYEEWDSDEWTQYQQEQETDGFSSDDEELRQQDTDIDTEQDSDIDADTENADLEAALNADLDTDTVNDDLDEALDTESEDEASSSDVEQDGGSWNQELINDHRLSDYMNRHKLHLNPDMPVSFDLALLLSSDRSSILKAPKVTHNGNMFVSLSHVQ